MWTLASHVYVYGENPAPAAIFCESNTFLKDTAIKNCVRCMMLDTAHKKLQKTASDDAVIKNCVLTVSTCTCGQGRS